MNKKNRGQLGNTVALILVIMGAIVMFLVITKFTSKATFDEAINTCRFSVVAQVASEIRPGITGSKSPFDINCEKRYVKFYNTKVELGLNPENMKARTLNFNGEKVIKFMTLSDLAVDQVIAEELRICKFQFADGKIEVFANDDKLSRGQTICFICSEIDFDPKVKQDTFSSLVEYTKKTSFDDTGTSYYDYLTEESYTYNDIWAQPDYTPSVSTPYMVNSLLNIGTSDKVKDYANLVIDKSKKYYVFFEKYDPVTKIAVLEKNVKINDPLMIEQYWVAIVPAEDINNYCRIQAS